VLGYPLTRTSRLHREGNAILLRRSKAFLWILIGLIAVRLLARNYVEHYVGTLQTGLAVLRTRVRHDPALARTDVSAVPAAHARGAGGNRLVHDWAAGRGQGGRDPAPGA